MSERYMYITIDVSEVNDWRGRWVARVVKTEVGGKPGNPTGNNQHSGNLSITKVSTVEDKPARGDTPLEAAADLLNYAVAERKRGVNDATDNQ